MQICGQFASLWRIDGKLSGSCYNKKHAFDCAITGGNSLNMCALSHLLLVMPLMMQLLVFPLGAVPYYLRVHLP